VTATDCYATQHNTVNKQCQSMVAVQLSTDTEEQISTK